MLIPSTPHPSPDMLFRVSLNRVAVEGSRRMLGGVVSITRTEPYTGALASVEAMAATGAGTLDRRACALGEQSFWMEHLLVCRGASVERKGKKSEWQPPKQK